MEAAGRGSPRLPRGRCRRPAAACRLTARLLDPRCDRAGRGRGAGESCRAPRRMLPWPLHGCCRMWAPVTRSCVTQCACWQRELALSPACAHEGFGCVCVVFFVCRYCSSVGLCVVRLPCIQGNVMTASGACMYPHATYTRRFLLAVCALFHAAPTCGCARVCHGAAQPQAQSAFGCVTADGGARRGSQVTVSQ